jgi:hypothetical protein
VSSLADIVAMAPKRSGSTVASSRPAKAARAEVPPEGGDIDVAEVAGAKFPHPHFPSEVGPLVA